MYIFFADFRLFAEAAARTLRYHKTIYYYYGSERSLKNKGGCYDEYQFKLDFSRQFESA